MGRRERTTFIRCAESGCRETAIYAYTSQRKYAEIHAGQRQSPWRCTRHRDPEQVLRPDNLTTSHVLVASRMRYGSDEYLPGLFWLPDGVGHGSGFAHGPGFKAHASDFPEGTRLVVSARAVMPEVGP